MRNRTNRLNRWLLTLVGLLLVVLGAGGLAMGQRAFGDRRAESSVVYPRAEQLLNREQDWLWWVLGAAALVIALLALYWLVVQLRLERVGSIRLSRDRTGDSRVSATALADAIRSDALALPDVQRARVRVMHEPDDPELLVTIALHEGADLGAVRHQVETDVIGHARTALGRSELRTWLRIELDAAQGERVR